MDDVIANRTQEAELTLAIAEGASALAYADLPAPVRALARQCVLDYLGVALAGAADPLVRILLDEVTEAAGTPQASIIGHEVRLPALSAALVNGAAAHALDYDDVNMAMPGHPSVAILPALLALAELKGSKRPGSNRNSEPCASRSTPARRRRTGSSPPVSPRAAFRAGPTLSNASKGSR